MSATLFLSPPHFSLLKPLKPLNSLSSNASSFFLQNPTFSSSKPTNNDTNQDDHITKNNNDKDTTNSDQTKLKMPTPPWMKGPLLVDSDEVIDLSKPKLKKKDSNFEVHRADKSLTEKVSGRMGKKALKKLVQSVEKLQLGSNLDGTQKNWDGAHRNWGDFGGGFVLASDGEEKLRKEMPWERSEKLRVSNDVVDVQKNWDGTQQIWDGAHDNWGDFGGGFALDKDEEERLRKKMPWKRGEKLRMSNDVVDTRKNWEGTQKNRDGAHDNWGDFGGGFVLDKGKEERIKKKMTWKRSEKLRVSNAIVDAQKSWGGIQKNWGGARKILGDFGGGFELDSDGEEKLRKRAMPWERSEGMVVLRRVKREKVATAAELSLDMELLERLRSEGSKMRKWIKVKKAGVTQAVVDEIYSVWANNELVMLKFDLPLCRNMDRAREIVEIKTGGLVVWSRKESLVAYRGCDYDSRKRFRRIYSGFAWGGKSSPSTINHQESQTCLSYPRQSYRSENMDGQKDFMSPAQMMSRNLGTKSSDRSLYEREGDRLLEGLGPRFIDWWYPKPLPVDGDLLPEVVPGFKPPFRLCPPDVRPQLTDDELTYLRKLARPLPFHFVLGRNSKLQGLAAAILKLWEKSVIVKIAVKWGVPNTDNELMASELKRLTGGVLLLRNKYFIILYRGKDFLPGNVGSMVVQREMELRQWQVHEEDARHIAAGSLNLNDETSADKSIIGTFAEYQHIQTFWENSHHGNSEAELELEAEKERLKKELKSQEHKLAILKLKMRKAEEELSKLNSAWVPSQEELDVELLTEEERECLGKMGRKMDRVLVLGRRGVFDGVIEGLHQQWKHRELVKVITMQKTSLQVLYTARFLEKESGGVLVSIDKQKKGHAIILYRGKNYRRPIEFGDNLLDKKKALKRSLERQRFGSLRFFAYQREKEIADLKLKLADLEKNRRETC